MAYPRGDQINVLGPSLLLQDKTNVKSAENSSVASVGDLQEELELDLSDEELLALAQEWRVRANNAKGEVEQRWKMNKAYAYGRQNADRQALHTTVVPDNILFEARETFLAAAFANNPDPLVWSDNTPRGIALSRQVNTMLSYLAEQSNLRDKLKMVVRHWDIYFVGILKHGWDNVLHDIVSDVRDPKNFLLDPNGFVDEFCDFTGFVGENISRPAHVLADMFPDKEQLIYEIVEGKMGTNCTWTEWWNDDYTFSEFKGHILSKNKNPNFNYPRRESDDLEKRAKQVLKEGKNYFVRPKKPYTFFEVFSVQEKPYDETSLIEQNIKNQDYIVERTEQIAKNLRSANNSIAFNIAAGFTEQTAKQAAQAMEQGSPLLTPIEPDKSVARFPAPGYPAEAFTELQMRANNLRNVYGTLGITAQQQTKDETVGSLVLNEQHSNDRIGGLFGDKIENFASAVYQQWVQMMHVFYDDEHAANIKGKLQAIEEASVTVESFGLPLMVKSAPNSMTPKDTISQARQALSLYESNIPVDPKTILELLNIPEVDRTFEGGLLFKMSPQQYIIQTMPELAAKLGLTQQAPALPQVSQATPAPMPATPVPAQEVAQSNSVV